MKTGVSYFGNRILQHYLDRDLPAMVAAGCSYVVHTFSEEDLRFYAGTVGQMADATREAGLDVYLDPWGVGGVFAGEPFSDFLVRHPDAWQVKADGSRSPTACPNAPQFRALLSEWLDAAAQLGPGTVFWDDPHWYIPPAAVGDGHDWACCCPHCQAKFRHRYGRAMPRQIDGEVARFRQESLVEMIVAGIDRVRGRGLRHAIGLLPFEDVEHGFCDWEALASTPDVDVLAVSVFWQLFGQDRDRSLPQWCRRLVEVCRASGKEPMVWLQAFLVEAGSEGELAVAAETAYAAGIRNVAAWGFRGCAHMSSIRCERPETMWQVIAETFRGLRARS